MSTTETKTESVKPSTTKKTIPDWEYSKRMKSEQTVTRTAKTGDETKVLYLFMIFGVSLTGAGLIYKKMKKLQLEHRSMMLRLFVIKICI